MSQATKKVAKVASVTARDAISRRWLGGRLGKDPSQARRFFFFLLGGTLCVALVAGGLGLYRGYRESQGVATLHQAVRLFQEGKADAAIPLLEQASRRLSREARLLALVFLGHALKAQAQEDKAREVYESLVKEKEEDHYLKQLVMMQLGQEAEQKHEFVRAQQFYERAAALPGPWQGLALLAKARAWQRLRRDSEAREVYTQFLATYPDSLLVDLVQQQIGE